MNHPRDSGWAAPLRSVLMTRAKRRYFIAVWVVGWGALGLGLFLLLKPPRSGDSEDGAARDRSPQTHEGDAHAGWNTKFYVADSACLMRPRAGVTETLRVGPIGDGDPVPYRIRQVQWGVIRPEPLPEPLTAPAVLMVGDSHLYGFCDVRENASTLLETRIRRRGWPEAIVANGSCPYYSLFQVAERMRTLAPHLAPRVCIAVVFVGNDFVELEDRGRPHLDDALQPQPRNPRPPAEKTSARHLLFNRCRPQQYDELFWQGINQAIYLHRHPERYPVLLAKGRRCVKRMRAQARASGGRLIVALIPAYDDFVDFDLPFDDCGIMGQVLAERWNRRLRLDFKEEVEGLGVPVVDLWPEFRDADADDLYAGDFHIWAEGHRVLAEALAPQVTRLLAQDAP